MPYSYDDCITSGLLRKIPPSKDKAIQSFKKAKAWLAEAENSNNSEAYNTTLLASYLVMFHSARAILSFDGVREKSHACIARYLEEKYVKASKLDKKWVDLLDFTREIRHDDQYDISFFSTKEDSDKALQSAKEFLKSMEDLFKAISK